MTVMVLKYSFSRSRNAVIHGKISRFAAFDNSPNSPPLGRNNSAILWFSPIAELRSDEQIIADQELGLG